jgi:hypothetical protein
MWDYIRKNGLDVMLTAYLLTNVGITGINAKDTLLERTAIGIGIIAITILYVTKACEAENNLRNLNKYKSSIYRSEIYTSNTPKYTDGTNQELTRLKAEHESNQGKGLYKHEVSYYRVGDNTYHVYISSFANNDDA